jgi:transposase
MSGKAAVFETQHSVEELKGHYRKSNCPVERRRTQAIWLLAEGRRRKEVMELTAYSKVNLIEIIRRYKTKGLEGLRDLRHENPGAPPLLSGEELAALAQRVKQDYQQKVQWNGNKVVAWAKESLDKDIYPQRAFEYLSRIGFSKQSPRRRHRKADKAQQEEFKKRP